MRITHLHILFITFFLSACQILPNEQTEMSTNSESKQTTQKKSSIPEVDDAVTLSPVVNSLLKQAQAQQSSGNNQAAIHTLERAIRIAPRYPESYYRLAELRYQQGNYQQATSLAQKALSLGASGELRQQSLLLISDSSG